MFIKSWGNGFVALDEFCHTGFNPTRLLVWDPLVCRDWVSFVGSSGSHSSSFPQRVGAQMLFRFMHAVDEYELGHH